MRARLPSAIKWLTGLLYWYSILLTFGVASVALFHYYRQGLVYQPYINGEFNYGSLPALTQLLEPWRILRNVGYLLSLVGFILAFADMSSSQQHRARTLTARIAKVFGALVLLTFSYPFAAVMTTAWLYGSLVK